MYMLQYNKYNLLSHFFFGCVYTVSRLKTMPWTRNKCAHLWEMLMLLPTAVIIACR